MRTVGSLLALAAFQAASPALADVVPSAKSGIELLAACEDQNQVSAVFCFGYIDGAADAWVEVRGVLCLPGGMTPFQLKLIIVKWMKANPELLHLNAGGLVQRALVTAYPCR